MVYEIIPIYKVGPEPIVINGVTTTLSGLSIGNLAYNPSYRGYNSI